MASHDALPLVILTEQFAKLPGIGKKSAARLAYHVMSMPSAEVETFAQALLNARQTVHFCQCCENLTDQKLCPICADDSRDSSVIGVVETPKDISAFERTGEYKGVYHVLHGASCRKSTARRNSRSHYGNKSHCGRRCNSSIHFTAVETIRGESVSFSIWLTGGRYAGICRRNYTLQGIGKQKCYVILS